MTEKLPYSDLELIDPSIVDIDAKHGVGTSEEISRTAEDEIRRSSDELHLKQMQEGLNEQEAIAEMRQKEMAHGEAIQEDTERMKAKIEALHMEALDDDLAWQQKEYAHGEAIQEDADRTEQGIYAKKQATAFAGKQFYEMDPQRIQRQEEIVEWAKEYHPAGLEDEVERLEKMRASTRNIDASRFVSRYWGGTLEEHKQAAEAFSQAVQGARNTDELLNVISEWGGIPGEDGKFVTNDRIRQSIVEVLKVQDESERKAGLEKLIKNQEVAEKFVELYAPDKEHLYDSLDSAREGTYDADAAISTVHSKLFQFSPMLYGMMSKKNRENLAELKKLGVPFDTEIERRSAAHIGLGFKLQNRRQEATQIREVINNRGMDTNQPRPNNQMYAAGKRVVKVESPKPILGGPGSQKKKSWLRRLFSF